MKGLRYAVGVLAVASAALAASTLPGGATNGGNTEIPRAELARVKAATAKYHQANGVERAVDDGFELLDVCFDDDAGGMGYHYVKGIDAELNATEPEALVYAPTEQGLKLVAVEYIVPDSLASEPPEVLGQHLHHHPELPLWILHAWIWQPNPDGMFADFNPNVVRCP